MNRLIQRATLLAGTLLLVLFSPGCGNGSDDDQRASTAQEDSPVLPTNRVAIPSAVRSNLGITFARAERRRIEETLRAPGRFEYLPTAAREYRTMLPGRVDVLVEQFARVEPGTLLFQINAPAWRDIQQEISQAFSDVSKLETKLATVRQVLAAHLRHEESLKHSIEIWNARVEKLEALREAGGSRMSEFTAAQSALATAQAKLASDEERAAEFEATRVQTETALIAANSHLELSIDAAAALLGLDSAELLAPASTDQDAPQTWRAITTIEVKATAPGVVESIDMANGAWADERTNVLTVVQPEKLRFHASGLQSDLGVLRDGLEVTIVPPTPTLAGNAVPLNSTMRGTLILGLSGDADKRTVDLYVTPKELASWARPGVSAQLEIVTDATSTPELAIPLAAVQRDGLLPIIFRRAPDNPNEAIRMDADLGVDDGRWVAILSGLRDGDEVILDGGFQLMLATSGSIQKGGHFHSDGTYHEGDD